MESRISSTCRRRYFYHKGHIHCCCGAAAGSSIVNYLYKLTCSIFLLKNKQRQRLATTCNDFIAEEDEDRLILCGSPLLLKDCAFVEDGVKITAQGVPFLPGSCARPPSISRRHPRIVPDNPALCCPRCAAILRRLHCLYNFESPASFFGRQFVRSDCSGCFKRLHNLEEDPRRKGTNNGTLYHAAATNDYEDR